MASELERIVPASKCIHKETCPNGERKVYFSALLIQYSHKVQWKVHLGDVVAVSRPGDDTPLTLQDIKEWEPLHLKKPSKHWRIGLVVSLCQKMSTSDSEPEYQCHVEWLEKVRDTKFFKVRAIKENFNPNNEIPFMLLRSNTVEPIDPALVLPADISMGTHKEFKKGIQWDETSKFQLTFYCSKQIRDDNVEAESKPDAWVELNPANKGQSKSIPKPLQQAFETYADQYKLSEELLLSLARGYQLIRGDQYMHRKNQQVMVTNLQQELEDAMEEQERNQAKGSSKRKSSGSAPPSKRSKKIRIQESPDVQMKQTQKENIKKRSSAVVSIVKKTPKTRGTTRTTTTSADVTTTPRITRAKLSANDPVTKSPVQTPATVDDTSRSTPSTHGGRLATRLHAPVKVEVESDSLLHHGKHRGAQCHFYQSITLHQLDDFQGRDNLSMKVSMGQVVLIDMDDDRSAIRDFHPFANRPWRVVQVIALYRIKNEWKVDVRSLLRFHDLAPHKRKKLKQRRFDQASGLLESMEVQECRAMDILPCQVDVTSNKGDLLPEEESITEHGGLQRLVLLCQHLQATNGKVSLKRDWTKFQERLHSMPGPLERAFQCKDIQKAVAKKFQDRMNEFGLILEREKSTSKQRRQIEASQSDSMDTEASSLTSLEVLPLTSKPMLEEWGNQFHDAVSVVVDRDALHSDFPPKTSHWVVKVGYVVPIRCEADPFLYGDGDDVWFPFRGSWGAGQVVALYKNEKGEWKMEVRWLNRYEDLLGRQQKAMSSLKGSHVLFETEQYQHMDISCCFPGRIVVNSCRVEKWDVAKSAVTGLPLVPRLCTNICVDEDVAEASDWTLYDTLLNTFPRPLARGILLSPRNRDNKEWIYLLSRHYKRQIQNRRSDPDEQLLQQWSNGSHVVQSKQFDDNKIDLTLGKQLHATSQANPLGHVHWCSMSCTLPVEYISNPDRMTRRARIRSFDCQIGDIVCYHDPDACHASDHITMKNVKHPWFPFNVPWSFGQILSIYRDASDESKVARLELRRFFRESELPKFVQDIVPLSDDTEREEVFESDVVVDSLKATLVLGTADVLLGQHSMAANMSSGSGQTSCRCRYFFVSSHDTLQPIFSIGLTPEIWFQRLCDRGRHLSRMRHAESLNLSTPQKQDIPMPLDVAGLLAGTDSENMAGTEIVPGNRDEKATLTRRLFLDCSVTPCWENVELSDVLFHPGDRGLLWKVKVGDFVSAKSRDFQGHGTTFPFGCQWVPCQVLSIYSDDGSSSAESMKFEVSYFQFEDTSRQKSGITEIQPKQRDKMGIEQAQDLLGPLVAFAGDDEDNNVWKNVPNGIPCALVRASEGVSKILQDILATSMVYGMEEREKVLKSLDVQEGTLDRHAVSPSSERTERSKGRPNQSGCTWTSTGPFYADVSGLRMFYSSMHVISSLKGVFDSTSRQELEEWRIEAGDKVLVHCEGGKRFPLACNWGVAEVVCIWKEFNTRDQLECSRHTSGNCSRGNLSVEIRWFYERNDLPGMMLSETSLGSDEVFETDDVSTVEVSSLIAPTKLYSGCESLPRLTFNGVPIPSFVCRRFWSSTRKSLIPCSGLEGSYERGKLYSKVLPEAARQFSRTANRRSATIAPDRTPSTSNWSEAMQSVITKLTLRDASKGVYERGEQLIGRGREMSQLQTFLRGAIKGEAGTGGVKSSILLAGPPGVGKTASVRAAISSIRAEEATGELPSFDFIPLNGMELRHPFEAYAKFWEALTGRKHIGSLEKACENLEYHFTNTKAGDQQKNGTTSVVLLDEIDYLITEKQSVLYNFFDWPKRAATIRNGRRLIVVGISNTLNLADQLIPSVQSRMGSERIPFKAYNLKDTVTILSSKIREASPGFTLFEDDAVLFAAKKTSALSGDIRKAFQLCRAATELVLQNHRNQQPNGPSSPSYPVVRISDVQKASRESFNVARVTSVSFATSMQALLLVALASLSRSTGREVGGFDLHNLLTKMASLAGASGDSQYSPPPAFGEILQLLTRLAESNLVELKGENSITPVFVSSNVWPMVSLAVDEHTLLRGLKNTPHKMLAETNLPSRF